MWASFGGDELLHERGGVEAELEGVGGAGGLGDGVAELGGAVEALDAGAGAADVRLYDDGPAETFGGGEGLLGAMDDAGLRVGQAEGFGEDELAGFAELGLEGLVAVDDFDAARGEVLEEAEGVEDLVAVVAVPGGGRHAVEDERVFFFGVVRGRVGVLGREELDVGRAAAVELGEEGFEPVGLLVVDGDGQGVGHGGC